MQQWMIDGSAASTAGRGAAAAPSPRSRIQRQSTRVVDTSHAGAVVILRRPALTCETGDFKLQQFEMSNEQSYIIIILLYRSKKR